MYITTIYSKLSSNKRHKIINFFLNNFNSNIDFEFEPMTIIILEMVDNEIISCICLYDNKFLIKKLNEHKINLSYFSINNDRNKKLGFNLLNYAIKKMSELNIDYLHTQVESEIAKNLFLKNNFIEDSVFNKSLINTKVFVMSKQLNKVISFPEI